MEPIDPAAMLATLAALAVFVRAAVQAIRRQWPDLDGIRVQLVALGVGALVAWGLDLQGAEALLEYVGAPAARVPHVAVDYLVTGGAIAAMAGLFADLTKTGGVLVDVELEEDEEPAPPG